MTSWGPGYHSRRRFERTLKTAVTFTVDGKSYTKAEFLAAFGPIPKPAAVASQQSVGAPSATATRTESNPLAS